MLLEEIFGYKNIKHVQIIVWGTLIIYYHEKYKWLNIFAQNNQFHFQILLKKMHSKWLCFLAGNSRTFTYFERLDMKIQVHLVNTKSTVYLFHILLLWTSCVAFVEVRLGNLTDSWDISTSYYQDSRNISMFIRH